MLQNPATLAENHSGSLNNLVGQIGHTFSEQVEDTGGPLTEVGKQGLNVLCR